MRVQYVSHTERDSLMSRAVGVSSVGLTDSTAEALERRACGSIARQAPR